MLSLIVVCLILVCGFTVILFFLYLFVACLIDAAKRSEQEFPDRTLWIFLLIGSALTGFIWISAPIYYYLYRPRLDYWNHQY